MAILNLILLLATLVVWNAECRDFGTYSTSFVHISAYIKRSGARVDMCGNYQQYRKRGGEIAESFEDAKPYVFKWWRSLVNNTKICPTPDPSESQLYYYGGVVPLDYRIESDGTPCTRPFTDTSTAFRNASQFQEDQLLKYNASAALFIIDRGFQFVQGWKDYLFSDFYDPYINVNHSLPTFFIYRSDFHDKILGLVNGNESFVEEEEELEIRFHRPKSHAFDASMLVIWLLAMTCVSGGGIWAYHRHSQGKDLQMAEAASSSGRHEGGNQGEDGKNSFMNRFGNYIAIGILMMILITVIMLGYYFRPVLVFLFNVMLVIFGTSSLHGCFRAFLSNFGFSKCTWYSLEIRWLPMMCGQKEAFTYTGALSVLCCFTVCVTWYFTRLTPYAFILLDIINVSLCLHILKSLRLPSLKWIFILMCCMFVYDAIMVFATPLWTKNGCSVMLEVATGMDCSSNRANSSGYPLPPISVEAMPEKFPMLMQVMHFDPMISCIDLEVELGYQMTILGLGDIIIPGYLVSHTFTMNGFDNRTRLLYGFVCTLGYGVGLIATFIALTLMKMAQPALIYLVPFTILPICILGVFRGEFGKLWHGVPFDKSILEDDSGLNSSRSSDEANISMVAEEPTNV